MIGLARRLAAVTLSALVLAVASPASAQTSASAYTTGTRYDLSGRVLGTILPDPDGAGPLHYAAVRNTYDAAGRLTKVEKGELGAWQSESVAPASWTGFTVQQSVDTVYDGLDRKLKVSVSSGGTIYGVTQYSYDVVGRLECTAVRMNPAVYGSLPASACTLGTQGGNGPDRITKNVYDDAGQLVQVREGVGSPVEAAEATYSYTDNGRKRYVIDGEGNRAELVYDGHDRQVQWIFPSTTRPSAYNGATASTALSTAGTVNASDYEQYGYDANGNRTSLRKRDGSTLTYAYDNLNRMTVKTVPSRAGLSAAQTRDVYYGYDVDGHMTKARFDSLSGDGITSSYNGFGELASSTIAMGALSKTLAYAYDKEGKRTELTHDDGQKFTYTRDGLGRLANLYEGTSQASTDQLLAASFDSRGLIDLLQRSTSGNAFAADFTFDAIGRLSSLANEATGTANDLTIGQAFNPASQIIDQTRSNDSYSWSGAVALTRAYTTNGLNQYTAAGPASFTYDANGNLTSDGSTTYLYDIENRLVGATGANSATLVWDPMGRLWQVTGATTDTRFLYDGDELVAEYDSAGTLARRYVHSDNVDDPVAQYDGASVGATYRIFLMPDERGSIAGLFANNGTSIAKNNYDEYGIPGSANQGRFQYTGQAWIPELGMYHYKARLYSPTLGRFLQTDPIGYDDQINLYAYVGDDPMNASDPSGECETRTGSIICEATKEVVTAVRDGDRTTIYRTTVSQRDGFVFRSRVWATEGATSSFSPLDLAVGARVVGVLAKGAEALGLIRGGPVVAPGSKTAALALRGFTQAETQGLRTLFGQGEKGAMEFSKKIASGQISTLPSGVSRTTLMRYVTEVLKTGPKSSGTVTQQLRMQGALRLLQMTE